MKRIHEANVGICSTTFGVGPRSDPLQELLEFYNFGDLKGDEVHMPCPSVTIGGLQFMRLQHHIANAGRHAPPHGDEDRVFPLQLRVTSDGDCVVYAASGCSADLEAYAGSFLASSATDAWLIGLPEVLITRWLRVTPATAAYRFDAGSEATKALCAYLRAWRFDELEAVVSPFEKELIAEHVMSLLAMAVSEHS
ncbi:hypothetical protein [Variovorax sp. LT1R16]|uniref:hypothetical protein n=1 Tax=Variovorax sp. LT1R16 TaxID=3443728 RepID=UPI003F48B501